MAFLSDVSARRTENCGHDTTRGGLEERQIADLLGQKAPSMARYCSRSANLADRNRITIETLEKRERTQIESCQTLQENCQTLKGSK
jgi:hypothetical protein